MKLLELDGVAFEPVGLYLKGARRGAGCEDLTSEGRYAVALQRHIRHHLGEQHVVAGIECLDGDGHRLLISGEEGIVTHIESLHSAARRVGDREARVDRGQSRGGVEALATGTVGSADLGHAGRTVIRRDDVEFGDDTAQDDIQVEWCGACNRHILRGAEGLAGALGGVACRGGARQDEHVTVAVSTADDYHGVVTDGQVALELTEGGVGAVV